MLKIAIAPAGFLFICGAHADDLKFNVCMGNGGGPSCGGKGNIVYSCDQYRAIGGGGDRTPRALGERLCKVFGANGERQLDYNVVHVSSEPGGECGWTLFTVTCFAPK